MVTAITLSLLTLSTSERHLPSGQRRLPPKFLPLTDRPIYHSEQRHRRIADLYAAVRRQFRCTGPQRSMGMVQPHACDTIELLPGLLSPIRWSAVPAGRQRHGVVIRRDRYGVNVTEQPVCNRCRHEQCGDERQLTHADVADDVPAGIQRREAHLPVCGGRFRGQQQLVGSWRLDGALTPDAHFWYKSRLSSACSAFRLAPSTSLRAGGSQM